MDRPKHATIFRKNLFWYLSYYDEQGLRQRVSTGTNNRKVAEERRREHERQMILGTGDLQRKIESALLDPGRREIVLEAIDTGRLMAVSKALDEYDTHSKTHKRDKTITNDRQRLNDFFDHANVQYINDVATRTVNGFLALKVSRDRSAPATLLRYREILHAFYEYARKQGYVRVNPVGNVQRPRIPDHDIRFLDLKQIEAVLKLADGHRIEAVIATAIYAGLRREEICWLTTEDVDLTKDRALIRVRAKTVGDEFWMPKTKKNRTVPVSTALYPYLARQSLKAGQGLWFFPSPEGCRWDPDNLGHRLSELMDTKDLPWGFLDFRHTFGSQLAQKGVSLYKISELMGNSPEIARRHYARLMPENMHAEVEFPVLPAPDDAQAAAE